MVEQYHLTDYDGFCVATGSKGDCAEEAKLLLEYRFFPVNVHLKSGVIIYVGSSPLLYRWHRRSANQLFLLPGACPVGSITPELTLLTDVK